jgi:uncharacterized membrane protein
MESRAKILGHAGHQMLVPLPLGALALSVVMDACYTVTGNHQHALTARRALDFGLAGAAVAVPFGVVDFLAIPSGTRAKRVGVGHAVGNLVMLGLFATSRLLRRGDPGCAAARGLSAAAFVASGVAAWLGGELVSRHAIGISEGSGLNAPGTLSHPAALEPQRTRDWGVLSGGADTVTESPGGSAPSGSV